MHTVENAVIIPVFTLIIVALISVSGYMHDKVVMRNILNQVGIECSKHMSDDELQQLLLRSERYMSDKTIFVKNISIRARGDKEDLSELTCNADWPLKLTYIGINIGNINMSQKVYRNRAEELIRKTNVLMKSTDE